MSKEINVLALVKGSERYVFLFDDDNRTETLRQIGRYAANPELSFTWYDAAVISQKIRQTAVENGQEAEHEMYDFDSRFRAPIPSDEPSDPLDPLDSFDWFEGDEAA